jgi:hypothetical protein
MNLSISYVEKWSNIVPQAENIDHDSASSAIKQIYHFLDLAEPPIFFASQPNQVLSTFLHHKLIETREYKQGNRVVPQLSRKQEVSLKHQLGADLAQTFSEELLSCLSIGIREQIGIDLESQLWISVENSIRKQVNSGYPELLRNCINCREWSCHAGKFDLCINELGVTYNPQLWSTLQNLIMSCNWFIPFTKVCLIGDCAITNFQ